MTHSMSLHGGSAQVMCDVAAVAGQHCAIWKSGDAAGPSRRLSASAGAGFAAADGEAERSAPLSQVIAMKWHCAPLSSWWRSRKKARYRYSGFVDCGPRPPTAVMLVNWKRHHVAVVEVVAAVAVAAKFVAGTSLASTSAAVASSIGQHSALLHWHWACC